MFVAPHKDIASEALIPVKVRKINGQSIHVRYYDQGDLCEGALSPKQAKFCENWVSNGFNGAKAIADAGYCDNNPNRYACQMLQSNAVNAYINYLLTKQKETVRPYLINEYIKIYNNDITEYFDQTVDDKGKPCLVLKDVSKLSKEQKKFIEEIKPTRYGMEVKLMSKTKALENIAKIINLSDQKADFNLTQNNTIINTIRRVIVSANQQSENGQNPPIIDIDPNE
jgi:phage terminase small subunit